MKNNLRRIGTFLLLLAFTSPLYPQSAKPGQKRAEQTGFGAEGDFENPIEMPSQALKVLRTSKYADDSIQMCATEAGIAPDKIPASWFVASEIRLARASASGLVVRGEEQCLGGAHIAQFWILAKKATDYEIVFRGRADSLAILPSRTNGYRDLQLVSITQAGAYVDYVKFRYRNGKYQKASDRLEHPN